MPVKGDVDDMNEVEYIKSKLEKTELLLGLTEEALESTFIDRINS